MKHFVFVLLTVSVFSLAASAKIRRVGFFGTPITGTDYVNFAAANTAALAGDTILMFPATTISGTISKKLVLIGPGNWLDAASTPKGNANLQAFPGIAKISSLTFEVGSDGSVLTGFYDGVVYVKDDNITIARNAELTVYITPFNPAGTISNLQVLQNYRVGVAQYYNNGSSATNMLVSNNLITYFSTPIGNTYNGTISNNVWTYDATQTANGLNGGTATYSGANGIDLGAGAYLLQNNIFLSYTNPTPASNYNYYIFTGGGNSVFNYNMGLQSSAAINFGTGTGNIIIPTANVANVFNAFPLIGAASADARYQLKAGSPALTAGAGNTPIGMFAGTSPYKLSTIPTIPTIYSLSSPQGNNPTGSTIQINVSTRGNN
jgi:hypothetical protein